MIVITTPTGDICHQVLKHVVQGSEPVRVVVRDRSRSSQEIRERVEVVQGWHGDAATIEKALTGPDALFWLIPPEPSVTLNRVDEAYADFTRPAANAITKCAVKRVVSVCEIGRGWNKEAGLVTATIKADDVLASTGGRTANIMMPTSWRTSYASQRRSRTRECFLSPFAQI